jgi:anti-anti-sigma factor
MLAVAPRCELEVERGPDCLFVRVADLDPTEIETCPLAERVWAVLRQHFTYRLVLELDQIRLLSSRLVAQLVQLHRRIEEHGGVLRLCGLSPHNRQVLRTCRLEHRLMPYQDRQEAIMGSERPNRPR